MNLTRRAIRGATVGAVAALALSACSSGGGVAARVGDAVVPMSDVELLTRVQCDAMASQAGMPGASVVPVSQVRAQAVNALVEAKINSQLAEAENPEYDTAYFAQAMDQLDNSLKSVKAKDRAATRELVTGFYRGQFQLMALAADELKAQGVTNPNEDEMRNAEAAIQGRFRTDHTVRIDPSFGPNASGVAGAEDPSMSVPVTFFAKQAASPSPKPSWVMGLPANQRCG